MAIDAQELLRVLYWHRGGSGRRSVDNVAYQLAALILDQRHFKSLAGLLDFLSEPENLKTWLPSTRDREACSASLLDMLSPLRAA